ncbi:MAG: ABC transporter permease [Pyrinomonadaceae bacterium]
MRFILSLSRREFRSSWRRLVFFFLCIALGVGSVVALRSLIRNVTLAAGVDARALMTADVEIGSTSDFAPADVAKIEDAVLRSGIVDARSETITSAVMARSADAANPNIKFVELKGIEPPFPLVGDFYLADGRPFDFALLQNGGAVVARIVLDDLGVEIGDRVRVGEATFEIRGVFDEEPGGTSGFRLGPRVFVEKKAFDDAGITRSNRTRRRILLRTTEDPTRLVAELRDRLRGTTLQVSSYREQQERLGEQFERTENYLALTGLLILVLGGVGVWNVARAFVEQKRRTVAVLKCLGASGTRIIAVYLTQIVVLGSIGSLAGVAFAQGALLLVKWRFAEALPAKMTYAVSAATGLQGVVLGVLISLIFSLLPLLQVRGIKPRLLLRDENNTQLSRFDRVRLALGAVSIAGLLGLAVWQAGSLRIGAFFLGGLAATSSILFLSAVALTRVLRGVRSIGSFSLRQAINSLYRPGNQTRIILLAVGLGAFVVLTVQSLASNLVREFDFTRSGRLPSLFFVDIQKSQIDELRHLVAERLGEQPETIPTVRARVAFVNGEPFDYKQREVRQQQGVIGREFAVTYRPELDENESIVAGSWWQGDDPVEPQVSVEEDIARTLGVAPGDSITFDISGRKITARVASVRKIDLRNTRTAFLFVFRPGALEKAPQSYAATVLRRAGATERQRLQREVLDRFPNVQVFDVADIIATVQRLVNNFVLAISFVGSFVILSGILILIGSIALTKSQRVYENAVLKTLGATRASLTRILLAEYGLLGLLAGLIGSGFAALLSWAVSRYLLNIEWRFDAAVFFAGITGTALLVLLVGVGASFDVLLRKPLATLRSQ